MDKDKSVNRLYVRKTTQNQSIIILKQYKNFKKKITKMSNINLQNKTEAQKQADELLQQLNGNQSNQLQSNTLSETSNTTSGSENNNQESKPLEPFSTDYDQFNFDDDDVKNDGQ